MRLCHNRVWPVPVLEVWWRHARSSRGQTTTEYLMIAAVLTAVAVLLAEIIPPMLVVYFRGIVTSISSRGM